MYIKLITATQVFKRNLKTLLCVCVYCMYVSVFLYVLQLLLVQSPTQTYRGITAFVQ